MEIGRKCIRIWIFGCQHHVVIFLCSPSQPKEVAHVNGERMENESEEEDLEDGEEWEEEEEQGGEEGVPTGQEKSRTSCLALQVEILVGLSAPQLRTLIK